MKGPVPNDITGYFILGVIFGILLYKSYAYITSDKDAQQQFDYEEVNVDAPTRQVPVDNVKMVRFCYLYV